MIQQFDACWGMGFENALSNDFASTEDTVDSYTDINDRQTFLYL